MIFNKIRNQDNEDEITLDQRNEKLAKDKFKDMKKGLFFTRIKTKKLVKKLLNDGINQLMFYTDCDNLLYILEAGILPLKYLHLPKGAKYTVWNYSQKHNYVDLELQNSSRVHFYDWIKDNKQKIDTSKLAVIGIDLISLFENSKKEWDSNSYNKTISINEKIDVECFKWIMIKNGNLHERLKTNIKTKKLNIKVFVGEKGLIK